MLTPIANFLEERHLEIEVGRLRAHLRNPHVLGLVLDNYFLEEVVLLDLALLGAFLLIALLLIQIRQVDLVAVLVLKRVQRPVRALFQQELRQV